MEYGGSTNARHDQLAFGADMTDSQWLRRRFAPVVVLAGTLGVLLGLGRGAVNTSFVGIQGMVVGGGLGFLAARLGKADSGVFWTFSQRTWLGMAVALVFTATNLVATSLAHAGPIDAPLYWLHEVVNGYQREAFFSVARMNHLAASGTLESGWWIMFMLLDAALLAFLFMAISVIGSGGGDAAAPDFAPKPTASARNGTLIVAVLLALSAVLYAYSPGQRAENLYSTQNLETIRQLAGEWRIERGLGLFAESEEARRFTLSVVGFNMLAGTSAGPGRFRLSIENRGDGYVGTLISGVDQGGSMPKYFRMKPSPDGSRMTMVFAVYGMGGRRDVTITASRP